MIWRNIAAIIQRHRVNTERQPAYHRLDVRGGHRKQLEHVNLVSFVSVFNVYNRRNLFRYYWSTGRNGAQSRNAFIPDRSRWPQFPLCITQRNQSATLRERHEYVHDAEIVRET